MGYEKVVFMNPFIKIGKTFFYRFFPSAFVNAYIRTLYLKKYMPKIPFHNALDAGCGPGLFTLFLADNFPKARFTGYDLSEENIQQCNRTASQKGLRNVSETASSSLPVLYRSPGYFISQQLRSLWIIGDCQKKR